MDWGFLRPGGTSGFRSPEKLRFVTFHAQGKNEIQPQLGLDEITS